MCIMIYRSIKTKNVWLVLKFLFNISNLVGFVTGCVWVSGEVDNTLNASRQTFSFKHLSSTYI